MWKVTLLIGYICKVDTIVTGTGLEALLQFRKARMKEYTARFSKGSHQHALFFHFVLCRRNRSWRGRSNRTDRPPGTDWSTKGHTTATSTCDNVVVHEQCANRAENVLEINTGKSKGNGGWMMTEWCLGWNLTTVVRERGKVELASPNLVDCSVT